MNHAATEQLRQERKTFEPNKRQAAPWFGLHLQMGLLIGDASHVG